MKRRALIVGAAMLLALFGARSALAQEAELDGVLEKLASAWRRGDAAAVVALSARAGLSLDLRGEAVGPLAARQATAVLRSVLEQHQTVSLETSSRQIVGGAPARAFGDLAWVTRARGTTIPERATIFLELVREDDEWRITQIRLIP